MCKLQACIFKFPHSSDSSSLIATRDFATICILFFSILLLQKFYNHHWSNNRELIPAAQIVRN